MLFNVIFHVLIGDVLKNGMFSSCEFLKKNYSKGIMGKIRVSVYT
jgi:hypothetical protein